MIRVLRIPRHHVGLRFRDQGFVELVRPGIHVFWSGLRRETVDIRSPRDPWLQHDKLDLIVQSGQLAGLAEVFDLADHQRALVWVDGRFNRILGPGLHAVWSTHRKIRAEVLDLKLSTARFQHPELATIVRTSGIEQYLEVHQVPPHHRGLLFQDGDHVDTLAPGLHATWRNVATVKLQLMDLREILLDISGQELMTSDKVTVRLNLLIVVKLVEALLAAKIVDDFKQAIYREAQILLRASISTRTLDGFLSDKDTVCRELQDRLQTRAAELGLTVRSVGIRDVILPGEMKDLLNKVTEAKTAAEAHLIARREETAAVRSQLNTAKMLQENPTLMRLRELEVLEKIAAAGKLNIVTGDKGLAERVLNLM